MQTAEPEKSGLAVRPESRGRRGEPHSPVLQGELSLQVPAMGTRVSGKVKGSGELRVGKEGQLALDGRADDARLRERVGPVHRVRVVAGLCDRALSAGGDTGDVARVRSALCVLCALVSLCPRLHGQRGAKGSQGSEI